VSPVNATLSDRIAEVVALARSQERTQWVAHVERLETADLPDLIACYATLGRQDRFLWSQGGSSNADLNGALAWGIGDETESTGTDRFADVRRWMQDVRSRIAFVGEARPRTAPTFFGGFGFEPESRGSEEWKAFPAARFILPAAILETSPEGARLVSIARVDPAATPESIEASLRARRDELFEPTAVEGAREASTASVERALERAPSAWPAGPEFNVRADRPHDVFKGQVELALDAFEKGDLEKVVLARSLSVEHDGVLDVPSFLGRLRELYPTCTLIAMGRGDDTFLAATPELLVRVSGSDVATAALAGSAPRGRHPEEDQAFGNGLLESEKERAEHRHVVDALREALQGNCATLDVPEAPVLRRLFGIQHLETAIVGTLRDEGETDVLALVDAMHPTPAVGGVPRPAAQSWLRGREGLDRGWYAAPIGWLDCEGGGDFRVALRSGLIRNGLRPIGERGASCARLFAGAGLVAGSEPAQELVETRIKLRALLAPLTEI